MSSEPAEPAEASEAEVNKPHPGRKSRIVKGAAIGIGSAAIVAALLYANRSARSKRARKED
ncbi:MAG: hypothetical protein E6G92_05975 [Alphaproteobacteria bacterium]|nr:MAG: hypothetical protein E6G92_05975 [Alphaproteobacteria bacterium]